MTPALLAVLVLAGGGDAAPPPPLTPEAAAPVFAVARGACEADAGALWGQTLCGPILLVDPATHAVVASHGDGEGRLNAVGSVWVGTLPTEISPSNTALEWAGVRWAMVQWPVPEAPEDQSRLLIHELFHRIQDSLRLPAASPANAHLDTEAGRAWLQLEWRALLAAFETPVHQGRRDSLVDALAFRAHRWSLFPEARTEEVALEKNEGLAEYTGVILGGAESARRQAMGRLRGAPAGNSFVRSFAYTSGPAYGIFLDGLRPRWRIEMPNRVVDFGRLLSLSLGLSLDEWRQLADSAPERAERYGGAKLFAAERERATRRERERASLRQRLVDDAVLHLDFRHMNIAFDPGELVPLEGHGTVYPGARITDEWGILTVTSGGALVDDGWTWVQVSAAKKPKLRRGVVHGDGWTLELAPGWRLVKGKKTALRRVRDWTLMPGPP